MAGCTHLRARLGRLLVTHRHRLHGLLWHVARCRHDSRMIGGLGTLLVGFGGAHPHRADQGNALARGRVPGLPRASREAWGHARPESKGVSREAEVWAAPLIDRTGGGGPRAHRLLPALEDHVRHLVAQLVRHLAPHRLDFPRPPSAAVVVSLVPRLYEDEAGAHNPRVADVLAHTEMPGRGVVPGNRELTATLVLHSSLLENFAVAWREKFELGCN